MSEQVVHANGIELCTEAFGDPAGPPLLLVAGMGSSMLWWEEGICRMLADGGRFVVRYDHRDTGRSTTFPPGRPGYTSRALVADALGVLDAYGLTATHLAGVSAGGGIGQLLALDNPERILSLALISTCPAVGGDRHLPPPTDAFVGFVTSAQVDWSDETSVERYLVAYLRILGGGRRPFDEAAMVDLVRRDVARAHDISSIQNHDAMAHDDGPHLPLSAIGAPTLVVHGSADPMFPIEHGEALAREIPDATLLRLDGAGHGVDRADWPTLTDAILAHTGGEPDRSA